MNPTDDGHCSTTRGLCPDLSVSRKTQMERWLPCDDRLDQDIFVTDSDRVLCATASLTRQMFYTYRLSVLTFWIWAIRTVTARPLWRLWILAGTMVRTHKAWTMSMRSAWVRHRHKLSPLSWHKASQEQPVRIYVPMFVYNISLVMNIVILNVKKKNLYKRPY